MLPIPGYPAMLEHIGDHLLKRRMDLQLNQRTAARRLGTNAWSLRNWETNRRAVKIRFYPAIIKFLGYNPLPNGKSLGERVRRERLTRGWSRAFLAKLAHVDEATIARIENDAPRLANRTMERVVRALCLERLCEGEL